MKFQKGKYLIGVGLLFLAMALSLSVYNMMESKKAGEQSEQVVLELKQSMIPSEEQLREEMHEAFPDMEMPTKTIEEKRYVGILEIPDLELELPVAAEWSEMQLKYTVCRYEGSVYRGDMIIAGHDYWTHFSGIKTLSPGAEIRFTDMEGHVFSYQVLEFEKIEGTDIAGMKEGTWDLTLFTCDYTGKNRIAVRCVEKEW